MTLIPQRATFAPDESVRIDLSSGVEGTVVVWHLDREVSRHRVTAADTTLDLGVLPIGGYGVELDRGTGVESTAFDVLADPFDRPRYGFIVNMTDAVDLDALAMNYRRHHLNTAQFYDWAYRHVQLVAPSDSYVDPLGQVRSLTSVNAIARKLKDVGTLPLAYTAVYGIGWEAREEWANSLLIRADGEPFQFSGEFLVIGDPAEPRWLEYYLDQLREVLEKTELVGYHLDQYGWPKRAHRADGTIVDMADSFATLIPAVREAVPESRFMFNNVNDFPTYRTAPLPQDATYIEVWDPHSSLGDLGALATKARSYRPEHPPILSAYLSCYTDGDERRATNAARLTMASIFSHGASHLLIGEDSNVLVHAYYPNNQVITSESRDSFVRWYDFLVRYGDLLMEPDLVDVTEEYAGGVNEEFVFESAGGIRFSTKAEPGTIWTRVVKTRHGFVLHLINLVSQTEVVWDAEKNESTVIDDLVLNLVPTGDSPVILAADPDADQSLTSVSLRAEQKPHEGELAAGEVPVQYELPPLRTWLLLFLPNGDDGSGRAR
jgi:dextranase